MLNKTNAIVPSATPKYCRLEYFSLNIKLAITKDNKIWIPVFIGAAKEIGTSVYTYRVKKFVNPFEIPPPAA